MISRITQSKQLLLFLLHFGSGNFPIDKNLISREQK